MRRIKSIPKIGKPKFAFIVDGECEYWYIQMLKRNERSIGVDLKPEIPQKKKLIDLFHKAIELSNDYDKVFWIVDFDTLIKETRVSKKGAKTAIQEFKEYKNEIYRNYKNITVIVNNPCLEYWILLHYETTSKYYEACEGVTKQLKKYISEYKKTQSFYTRQDNDIYLRLKPLLSKAISNAEKLGEFDFESLNTGMSEMQLFFNSEQIKKIIEAK
jgi:hypothetical protein